MDSISTEVEGLDRLLGGGLCSGLIFEAFGNPGCGKTNLAMHFASVVVRQKDYPRTVLFYDTQLDFRWHRFLKLCDDDMKMTDRIRVKRVYCVDHLINSLECVKTSWLLQRDILIARLRLLVIDSIGFIFYPERPADARIDKKWHAKQEAVINLLDWMARTMGITVFLTNIAVADYTGSHRIKPSMGALWSRRIIHRLMIIKSPVLNTDVIVNPRLFHAFNYKGCFSQESVRFNVLHDGIWSA